MKSVINCYACPAPTRVCPPPPFQIIFCHLPLWSLRHTSYLFSDSLNSFQLVLRFLIMLGKPYRYQTESSFIWGDHVPKHPLMPDTMQKRLFLISHKMPVWWTWHVIRPCCPWEFPMVFDKLFVCCFSILLSLPHSFSPLLILDLFLHLLYKQQFEFKILWKIKCISLIISILNVSNHSKTMPGY